MHEIAFSLSVQQMSERTLVPIFIFWALLTIITPTLILWSENSNAQFHVNGNTTEAMKARRMKDYIQNHTIQTPTAAAVVAADEPATPPVPAPPTASLRTGRINMTSSYHDRNYTLGSNKTDDEHRLFSPKKQVNQTKLRSSV